MLVCCTLQIIILRGNKGILVVLHWYILRKVIIEAMLYLQDGKLLPGAGATELELARQISAYGDTLPGLEQYSVKKFASAFEYFVKVLAENSGRKSNDLLAKLYALHHEGKTTYGFNIEVFHL
jgi:chaperonin GroEL (HSP60 family)